jgi:hypothetical protein
MNGRTLRLTLIIISLLSLINDCLACPEPVVIDLPCIIYYIPVNEPNSLGAYLHDYEKGTIDMDPDTWHWDAVPSGLNIVETSPPGDNHYSCVEFSSTSTGTFYTVTVTGLTTEGYPAEGSVCVVPVDIDLDINNVDDYYEISPGGYIAINNDDDNGNDIPDCEESGIDEENDLIPIYLNRSPERIFGKIRLAINNDCIALWLDPTKSTGVELIYYNNNLWYAEWNPGTCPEVLYVESWGSATLTLEFLPAVENLYYGWSMKDVVNFSSVQVWSMYVPEYIAYGTSTEIYYYILIGDYLTADSVKLYIKQGDTIIRQVNGLDCESSYLPHTYAWNGKDGTEPSGNYLNPGEYTLEIEATKNGIKHSKKKNITIYKVTNVQWEKFGDNWDLGNDSEGKTIFPDKKDYNDPNTQRNRIKVIATITPQIANLPVYFKWMDVDDPCGSPIDTKPDEYPSHGPDNFGGTDAVLTPTNKNTDGSGKAIVDFYVTKQPGDNFRIAASASQNQLNTVDYFSIERNDPNTWPTGVYFSPRLTVWRHLWIERDSMKSVNSAGYVISENFSSGKPGAPIWNYYSNSQGRIEVTGGGRLRMDDSVADETYSLNEAIMSFNMTGLNNLALFVNHWNLYDDTHNMPSEFTGHNNSDGIAISINGTNWKKISSLTGSSTITVNTNMESLFGEDPNLSNVQIKFQQYDNSTAPYADGREFDNIYLVLETSEQNFVYGTNATYSAYNTPLSGQTTVYLHRDLPDEFEDEDQFEDGTFFAGGNSYTIISSEDRGGLNWDNDIVVVNGNATGAGGIYVLYDDDDQNILNNPYYCSMGSYVIAFEAACIEPVELPNSYSDVVEFNRNLTDDEFDDGDGDWDSGQDIITSADFWACTVVTGYQPGHDEDNDNEDFGGTGGGVDPDCSPNTNMAVIFIEQIRDAFDGFPPSCISLLVAHEIGHTGGGDHGDGDNYTIMGDDYGQFSFSNTKKFAAKTIKTFRSNVIWKASN